MPDTPFREIANSTYDWETWVDEHGRIRWVNPAVERLTGYPPEACMAMPGFPLVLVHEEDQPRIREVLARCERREAGNDVSFRILHRDGRVLWAAISWQPLVTEDGEPRGYRTSVRDIDERNRAEERLREAERRASRMVNEQAELLATLSHELRSPLHCISGFSELLEQRGLDATAQRYVTIVHEQSDAALRLVEDLLHFVSLAESHVTLRSSPFELAGMLARKVEAMRPRVREGVVVSLSVGEGAEGYFVGDPDRIRQIVSNLLSNAARFTERGRIDVLLGLADEGVVIEVRDTGIGMRRELLARVKEPFVQGTPSSSSRGGVGLGLAIVDRLASAMGGTVSLSSTEGYGTSVLVALPLARADLDVAHERDTGRLSAPSPLEEARRFEGLRVLVVDDSEHARELLGAMFATFGASTDTVGSGYAALHRTKTEPYELVVLDYHMPELDGLETARAMRAQAPARRPMLVMLTANVLAEAFSDPARYGLDLVLPKPLRLAQVSALCERAREGKHAGDELDVEVQSVPTSTIDEAVARELLSVRTAEGTTLLARTLPRVSDYVKRVVGTVRAALADGVSFELALVRELHSVKGLVASVGAREAAALAAKVENALRAEARPDEVRARLDAFERAYGSAHAVLARLAAREDQG